MIISVAKKWHLPLTKRTTSSANELSGIDHLRVNKMTAFPVTAKVKSKKFSGHKKMYQREDDFLIN